MQPSRYQRGPLVHVLSCALPRNTSSTMQGGYRFCERIDLEGNGRVVNGSTTVLSTSYLLLATCYNTQSSTPLTFSRVVWRSPTIIIKPRQLADIQ